MSVSLTLPLKVARTGPTASFTRAVMSVGDCITRDSQPVMHCLRMSGSFSAAHTFWRLAAIWREPVMSMECLLNSWLALVDQSVRSIGLRDAGAALTTAPRLYDLGENGERDLLGRHGADVEAGRGVQCREARRVG